MPDPSPNQMSADIFATTHWSIILQAASPSEQAQSALEKLCHTYWYPLYGYLRRRGYDEHHSQDLTQEFVARFIEGSSLQNAHPDKKRFRAFLLASMKNFLAKEARDANRLKRGGGQTIISWDGMDAERRFEHEPADSLTAEGWFDQRWAQTVLETALERLGKEMEREGIRARFDGLKQFLQCDVAGLSHTEATEKLGLSESATKTAIFRMRGRYDELIREEIAQTVTAPEEVEDEIKSLISLLAT